MVAPRNATVDTALWPLAPEERVPMDLGHAFTSMAWRAGFGQHVEKSWQGLVLRVHTPIVRTSAVAVADVVQTQVSNDRDPADNLNMTNMRVE